MNKAFAFLGLVILSHAVPALAYYEQVPIVREDADDCTLRPWHQLGGCYQNKTGAKITDDNLYYRQSIYYNDKRTMIVALIHMSATHPERYIVVSTSAEVLTQNHITKVVNELVEGHATTGPSLPGCHFEITDSAPVTEMAFTKSGASYTCKLSK